jgi:hypothetical protein
MQSMCLAFFTLAYTEVVFIKKNHQWSFNLNII